MRAPLHIKYFAGQIFMTTFYILKSITVCKFIILEFKVFNLLNKPKNLKIRKNIHEILVENPILMYILTLYIVMYIVTILHFIQHFGIKN